MKTMGIRSLVVLGCLAIAIMMAVPMTTATYAQNQQQVSVYSYLYPIPPINNTSPQLPMDNGSTTIPPEDNLTSPLQPTETKNQNDSPNIVVNATAIRSTEIGDGIIGVRVLPPTPGFEWNGDISWHATGNVTLVAIQSNGDTTVSQEGSIGSSHFTVTALEFQSITGEAVDITYHLRAHFHAVPGPK